MSLALGIDVAEARKGLDLVVLDSDRAVVVTKRRATFEDVTALVRDQRPDVVCIDSPPGWASAGRSRAAERTLRTLGITAFSTPVDPGDHSFYRWMRVGFEIFAAVAETHPRYRAGEVTGTAVEVFPEASAVLLAGRLRPVDESKGTFRRQVLRKAGVDTTTLRSIDSVDAALAAVTGLLALEGVFSAIGDPQEGGIVVPGSPLPSVPLRRAAPSGAPAPPRSGAEQSPDGFCMCGCGAPVRRRFLPGHDAKLASRLAKERATEREQ